MLLIAGVGSLGEGADAHAREDGLPLDQVEPYRGHVQHGHVLEELAGLLVQLEGLPRDGAVGLLRARDRHQPEERQALRSRERGKGKIARG